MTTIETEFAMNILIVSTNRNKQFMPVMPVGACIVAEAAEKADHKVRVIGFHVL
jgi:hypothetical protein